MSASWPTVLAVVMASVCSLLLGMHLQREYLTPWATHATLISLVAAKRQSVSGADSVSETGGRVQKHGAPPMGTAAPRAHNTSSASAAHSSGSRSQPPARDVSVAAAKGGSQPPQKAKQRKPRSKPRRPAAGLRSQRVSCSTLPLPEKWKWYNIYNPAGATTCTAVRITAAFINIMTVMPHQLTTVCSSFHVILQPIFDTPSTGVFDPKRGWIVLVRHEYEWYGPSPTLAVLMGKDKDAPNATFAASHQMLLQMDNATLGADFAQKHYGRAWLKSEDLRQAN
jgi:hypothetical protein